MNVRAPLLTSFQQPMRARRHATRISTPRAQRRRDATLPPRERFGRFVLLAPLAAAEDGALTVACDVEEHRFVVLKRLRTAPHSVADLARFLDEGQLALRQRHPNLVHAVGSGATADEVWVALDWTPGPTLDTVVARAAGVQSGLPFGLAASLLRPLLSALAWSHAELGFVDRDFGPGNVIVGFDGVVRLSAHGLGAPNLRFRAPEQRGGARGDLASDVWAAAALLHFALTGEAPAVDETADSEPALRERLESWRISLPPPLVRWLWHGLQANPANRPPTALDLQAALAAALTEPPGAEADLAAFVEGHFPEEKQALAQDLAHWRRELGADAPAPDEGTVAVPSFIVVERTGAIRLDGKAEPPMPLGRRLPTRSLRVVESTPVPMARTEEATTRVRTPLALTPLVPERSVPTRVTPSTPAPVGPATPTPTEAGRTRATELAPTPTELAGANEAVALAHAGAPSERVLGAPEPAAPIPAPLAVTGPARSERMHRVPESAAPMPAPLAATGPARSERMHRVPEPAAPVLAPLALTAPACSERVHRAPEPAAPVPAPLALTARVTDRSHRRLVIALSAGLASALGCLVLFHGRTPPSAAHPGPAPSAVAAVPVSASAAPPVAPSALAPPAAPVAHATTPPAAAPPAAARPAAAPLPAPPDATAARHHALSAVAAQRLDEAHALARAGELQAARALYLDLVDDDAAAPRAATALAELSYRAGDYEGAIAYASAAIQHNVGSAAYRLRGAAELQAGRPDDAARDFRYVLIRHPDDADARAGLDRALAPTP